MAKKVKIPLAVSACPTVGNAVYVGVDQSYTGSGVVMFDGDGKLIDHTLIETKPGTKPMDQIDRITGIFQTIYDWVNNKAAGRKVCVVMEDFAYAQANQMAALGGLGWFLRIMFARAGWHFSTCPTSVLKQVATGKGNSEKEVVMMCVYKRWTFESSDNNVADAYVLGKLAWMAYGKPSPDPALGIRKGDLEGVQKLTVYR
jgi:crossover junction endodeoxyribonuclease RuvC